MLHPNPNEPFYAVVYDELSRCYHSNITITSFEECLDKIQTVVNLIQGEETPFPYTVRTWSDVVNFCKTYDYLVIALTKEQLDAFVTISKGSESRNRLSFIQSQQFDRYLTRTS